MDSEKIIAVVGYILAVFLPVIGIIYGTILFFIKGDDEYIRNHAKYIIIIGAVFLALRFSLFTFYHI